VWDDGSEYTGTFVNGIKEGMGRYAFTDGAAWEGLFKDDKRVAEEGEFVNSIEEGPSEGNRSFR